MASAQNPAANADLFDVYFRRADLDHDGRISGVEAVSFFQGSGLSKHVLAQIWAYADQRQTGFLGRAEFYNALKLVTVAQSKRQLTPEMVKAALYGPAAAKIPPPQINLAATPAPQPQPNSTTSASAAHGTAVAPMSQNLGYGGPQGNVILNQQHLMKPPLPTSASASQLTHGLASQGVPRGGAMGGPRPPTSNVSNDWAAGRTGGAPSGTSSQIPNKGISPSMAMDGFGLTTSGSTASLPPRPQTVSGMNPSGPQTKDTKEISGNGFASGSIFGGDAFSATPSQPNQDSSSHAFSVSNTPVSSAVVPHSVGTPSVRPTSLDSLQSSLMTQIAGGQFQQDQSLVKHSQDVSAQTTSTYATAGVSVRAENSASGQSQMTWPKISPTDVQKYTKVFVEVDTDRDGKITGEQARNLFLSWRLPREVLKQVWDLSDQDNDSMLSLREFCVAVYLMERYREGCSLPAALPRNILFDLSSVLQSTTNYGNSVSAAWRPSFGSHQQQQQGMPGPGARHVLHAAGPRPPLPVATPRAVEGRTDPPKSKVPVLEKHLVNQLSTEEQNVLNSKLQEVTEADKKVDELEKEILDSKEKIEFYRTKMQELVLYKSRCDNRLNEIVERTSADKREVESLSRKYEEKYKQGGDVASKLTIEEATFRDIQEKKMELYQAIVKMEQDGGTDGVLQVGVDRIQSELDELVKSLNERCKKYGLRGKPTTLTELPFGWQPGIQHGAADWDEDWDKFEDEGFTFVKELTLDVQNVLAPPKQKSKLVQNEEASAVESPATVSTPNGDVKSVDPHTVNKSDGHIVDKSDDPHNGDERIVENGSAYNKSEEESAKSAPNSPFSSSAVGSPSREFQYSNRGKSIVADTSPRNKENQSDHGGTSAFSGDKSFDEAPWGTFDANDDINSVWDFNSVSSLKDTDHERNNDNYYSGSGEFGLNPIKTGSSSQSGSIAQSGRPFSFDDSVPSTPLYNFSNSPPRYKEGSEPSFDSFSRFDSFSTHDGGPFQQREAFSRFDSMRSSRDFDQSHGFPSFDDFGALGPFKSSLETPRSGFDSLAETPRRGFENWGETPRASDNWGETSRRSSDTWSETPRKGSENWSAF